MIIVDTIAYFAYQAFSVVWPVAWPILGTFLLGYAAFKIWMHYIRQSFISGIDWVLLEIIPPREVLRSPKAMELFFTNALYHLSKKGGKETYWQGAVWFWFSLEIVSIDGQVHFYIRTPTRVRGLIETQLYAQYPQAQVKEVEDYTLAVDKISKDSDWKLWGCEFKLAEADPLPIKTYDDFGLSDDPKEEYKVDPISPVIELFASIQKGEQLWLQIVITPAQKEYRTKGTWFKTHDWIDEGEELMKELSAPYTKVAERKDRPGEFSQEVRPPDWLKPVLEAITEKTYKVAFETGIRLVYVAKKEAFQMNTRRNCRLIFRQYEAPYMNGFARFNATQADAYGGFFTISQDTVMRLSDRMLHEYRERAFFHLPMRHHLLSKDVIPWPFSPALFPGYFHPHVIVLNVEELATIWHFPGQVLKVPSLERIESKESSPPSNLPI